MDATKLIEEVGPWAQHMRQSPRNGTAGEDLYLAGLLDKLIAALRESEERAEKAEQQIARWEKRCESTDEQCRGFVLAQRIAEVAAAGDDAALHAECGGKMHETGREAALRVIEHLRKSAAGQQKRAEKAEHQHDVLAAANLAANKRIVELEHERDAAVTRCGMFKDLLQQAQQPQPQVIALRNDYLRVVSERDAARAELEAERRKGCSNV